MGFMDFLNKLNTIKDLLTDSVPDALDRTAEIADQVAEALRDGAEWLRKLGDGPLFAAKAKKDKVQEATEEGFDKAQAKDAKKAKKEVKKERKEEEDTLTNEQVQELRNLHKAFGTLAAQKPHAIKVHRGRKEGVNPEVLVAFSRICHYAASQVLNRVENK